MRRTAAIAFALEVTALTVAVLAFGWTVLVVGLPLLVGTLLVFLTVVVSEGPRRRLQDRRAAGRETGGAVPGGLMSGFFEVSR